MELRILPNFFSPKRHLFSTPTDKLSLFGPSLCNNDKLIHCGMKTQFGKEKRSKLLRKKVYFRKYTLNDLSLPHK